MELVKKEERVYYAPAEGAADSIGHMDKGFAGSRSLYHPVIKAFALILSFSSFCKAGYKPCLFL